MYWVQGRAKSDLRVIEVCYNARDGRSEVDASGDVFGDGGIGRWGCSIQGETTARENMRN